MVIDLTRMSLNKVSLSRRLFLSTMLVLILVLPLLFFALKNIFEHQAEMTERQTMRAFSFELMGNLEILNGAISKDIELSAPAFSIPNSGLYALIRRGDEVIWHSDSLIVSPINTSWFQSAPGQTHFETKTWTDEQIFNWQMQVIIEQGDKTYPLTIHILKSIEDFHQQMQSFERILWRWVIIIGATILTLQVFWMLWFKQPLRHLMDEIIQIEEGNQLQIHGEYPAEIQQVNKRLNQLLANEKIQRERYKNKLTDLAHSLKTPLALINTREDLPVKLQADLDHITDIINHQLKKSQSTAQLLHMSEHLSPIIITLISSLKKIYVQKDIQFAVEVSENIRFRGAKEDLYELLGNLLDNAAKACNNKVLIEASEFPHLTLMIHDDGQGLSNDQLETIMKRGHRADTYEQGHGIGLSIVQDILSSYQGRLEITGDGKLGGASFTIIFPE